MNQKEYLSKENVEAIWELSLLQKELFHRFDSGESGNGGILQLAFQINGGPEPGKIREAWRQTVRQTPLLRTVFRKARNRTVQVVLKEYPGQVDTLDMKDHPHPDAGSLPFSPPDDSPATFNLMEEAAVKLRLVRNSDGVTIPLLICHPIILDRQGLVSVLEDFMSIYISLLNGGRVPALKRPPFKDYLDWLGRQYWHPAVAHWKNELAGFTAPTPLVRYQRFPSRENPRYSLQQHRLTGEQSRQLEQLCAGEGIAPDIVIQAAWALLLSLYSRERDICFGVELEGRPEGSESFQSAVGPFANILPIRLTIHAGQTLREFIRGITGKNEHLRRYSYVPLEEIRSKLDLPAGTALFESSISVNPGVNETSGENPVPENIDIRQIHPHPFALEVITGKTWRLRLFCFDGGVPDAFVLQVLKHLQTLLAEIGKNPGARVDQVSYLSSEDSAKLEEFNRPAVQLPDGCLDGFMHRVFEEQVEKTPMAIACRGEGHQVSYQELNNRANRLAHWLKEQGITANGLVGIFCRRSIEMLTAVLAVFKAGGGYIPFDPGNPDSRIKTMVLDSGVEVIFTRAPEAQRTIGLLEKLPVSTRVFCLDPLPGETTGEIPNAAQLQGYSTVNPPLINQPRDIAYVIFTSGSTGVPKGAIVEHIGMLNHLWTKIRLLNISSSSKVAQNASHCFDISVWQFLAALMKGGQIVVYGNEVAMDPLLLRKQARKDRVTILEMVPAVIAMMLEEDGETALPDIRCMLSTGEALPTVLCRKWMEIYPHIPVVNAYGPTECSDDTHHRTVSSTDPPEDHYNEVPLGGIIPNFEGYIADKAMRILPAGCVGEICLTGIGVGKGYLNNPARTAGVFIKNPLADGMGDRMYRTGDLGYLDARGQLVFLGRIDHQVKIRGHRIELGEIEARLRKHPGVKQCAAVIKDSQKQKRLIAYVVLKETKNVSTADMKTYLQESLPHYMVPEHILELEALPLNRSGKIDRKALPDPDHMTRSTEQLELPSTGLEKKLAQIWENVLEISPIGVNQNFFELGGHSLRIIQARSRIYKLFGVDISIIDLFRLQTISQLARFIEEQLSGAGPARKSRITRIPAASYYPMSHAQQRLFFLHQLEPENTAYNIPTALEVLAPLHLENLKKALKLLSGRQASLRTRFGIVDNRPVQFVADAENHEIHFRFEDLSHLDAEPREKTLADHLYKETHFKFDLSKAPLFYTVVFQLEEQRYLLFFNMHHIIGDFWSWEIFVKELFTLYQLVMENKEIPFAAPDIQYVDYASWQNKSIENGDFQVHADYWTGQFSGDLPRLELPLDFPRPAFKEFSGGSVSRAMPADCMQPMRLLFQQKQVTSFIGLMATFCAFLSRMAGQQDIILGTVEAGRNYVEIEKLIGFFVNTLPLRFNLEGNPSLADLLDHVKDVNLEAYQHAEYPFDMIINSLNLERDLSRYPLFSVMFQVMDMDEAGTGENETQKSALPVRLFNVPMTSTNYDLRVIFTETPETYNCTMVFCKALFKVETIRRWIEHFIIFFRAIIATPGQPISRAPMLTEEQRRQLLDDWNDTHVPYPQDQTFHSLFENQVEKTPDNIAAVAGVRSGPGHHALTYRELDQASGHVACLLREKGVGPDTIAAVMTERSIEMIIGILAILKAGGAYLPIDPGYPRARIDYMLEDSKAKVILASPESGADLKEEEIELIDIHNLRYSSTSTFSKVRSANLAYVIYTSGTTGKPKGVFLTHRNLVNYVTWFAGKLGLTREDISVLTSSFAFDLGNTSVYPPLLRGGQVHIVSKDLYMSPRDLLDYIYLHRVSYVKVTPSLFGVMVEDPNFTPVRSKRLRMVVLGGEALNVTDVEKAHAICPNIEFMNHYGPTEATIGCIARMIGLEHLEAYKQAVTIGTPIFNTSVLILDRYLNIQPVGIAGELCVGGEGIARGYLNNPELTAKKFICSPLTLNSKHRTLYKTGDLARWLPDGNIAFLGRIGHQVKIRGYRIELKEIEIQLLKHPDIKEAVVVKKDKQNEASLCAYIQFNSRAQEPAAFNADELKDFLSKELPAYMIPGQFIRVDAIPLAPSGKIDRKVLMTMGERIETGKTYQPPQSLTERIIADAWQEILELDRVSIHDDFFEIGGYSLNAMRLISMLNDREMMININDFFRYPTIYKLGQYVDSIAEENKSFLQTFEEAEEIFEKEFGAKGEFATFHIKQENYHVFYVDDSLPQDRCEKIAGFFRDLPAGRLFPHFIRPYSQKPALDGREMELSPDAFSVLLQLKADVPGLEETFIQKWKREFSQFNEAIVHNESLKKYPLSPIQRVHLAAGNPLAHNKVVFDQPLDIGLFEEAFLELIKEQGLLRSILLKKDDPPTWNELSPPARIKIPYIDLIEYDDKLKTRIIHDIVVHESMRDFHDERQILYKPILFRKDLRTYNLFITFSHPASDNISGEIMARTLRHYYELKQGKQSFLLHKPEPYSGYIEQINRGPRDIDEDSLLERFELEEYIRCAGMFERMIEEKKTEKMDFFNYTVKFEKPMNPEHVWNLTFVAWNLYLKRYFQVNKLPIRLIYHGRHYQQRYFFDTVGDFLDYIPVLVSVNEDAPFEMIKDAQEKVNNVSKHNISFMNLMLDSRLKQRWKRLADIIKSWKPDRKEEWIIFNFEERKSGRDVIQTELSGQQLETFLLTSLFCEVHYTPTLSSFNVFSALDIDRPLLTKILTEELETIAGKLNLEI